MYNLPVPKNGSIQSYDVLKIAQQKSNRCCMQNRRVVHVPVHSDI